MKQERPPRLTQQELERISRELNIPIDFDALIKDGVLEKRGAWYKILKKRKLPPYVLRQAKEAKEVTGEGVFIKFPARARKRLPH